MAILAISVEEDDVVLKFMEKNGNDIRVARNREVSGDYGVSVLPTIALIGKKGRIQYRHLGFDSDVDLTQKLSDEIESLLQGNVHKNYRFRNFGSVAPPSLRRDLNS